MKKIFTLIFSLGLLTAAFAQGGHRQREYNSSHGSGNQTTYQGDHQKYGTYQGQQTMPYSNSDNWNYQSNDRTNEHRYGKEVNNLDGFGDRDDMRRRSGNSGFNDKRFSKGINKRHSETYKRKPGLQIFFALGSHHK